MRLFEIADTIERLLIEGTDPETGEISEDCLAELGELELDRETKICDLVLYALGEEAESKAVREQADRLTARARVHQRRADRLRKWLAESILEKGEKVSDDRVQVRASESTYTDIYDAAAVERAWSKAQVPASCIRVTSEVSKSGVAAAIKDGVNVPGARRLKRRGMVIK